MTESEFKRLSKIAPHKAWAAFKEQKQTIEVQAKEIERLKGECLVLAAMVEKIPALDKENKELKKLRLKSSMRAVDEGRTFERDLIE